MPASASPLLTLGIILSAALVSPALAAPAPETRLVECAAGDCLLVTGYRADVASTISVNGHAVSVEGRRNWRATLPVATLRQWSAPYARTITVTVVDASRATLASNETDLPIGLLGHDTDLAMLVVRMK